MNVNKKFDRLKQWGKERMGGEARTATTDDFKALEVEMQLRQDGMERLKKSADVYVRSISKRDKFEDREQQLPVGYFGSTLVSHGDDFEPDSEFGQCLALLGRANERIARTQETYCANATSSWLESLERSLVQMKEYQAARKKLESRRLAYDTASAKMQKSKKEDFRMEEELRSQKMKYEESNEDVYRRMLDIKEAEVDSVSDLTSFLEAELAYYDRCREVLLHLKREWPATTSSTRGSGTSSPVNSSGRHDYRSRTPSASDRFTHHAEDERLDPPIRPTLTTRSLSSNFEGQTSSHLREPASAGGIGVRLARTPTEPTRNNTLRIPPIRGGDSSTSADDPPSATTSTSSPSSESQISSAAAGYHGDYAAAPTSVSRRPSWTSTMAQHGGSSELGGAVAASAAAKRAPPPPPSRARKPPPPPPPAPLKRNAVSSGQVQRY